MAAAGAQCICGLGSWICLKSGALRLSGLSKTHSRDVGRFDLDCDRSPLDRVAVQSTATYSSRFRGDTFIVEPSVELGGVSTRRGNDSAAYTRNQFAASEFGCDPVHDHFGESAAVSVTADDRAGRTRDPCSFTAAEYATRKLADFAAKLGFTAAALRLLSHGLGSVYQAALTTACGSDGELADTAPILGHCAAAVSLWAGRTGSADSSAFSAATDELGALYAADRSVEAAGMVAVTFVGTATAECSATDSDTETCT